MRTALYSQQTCTLEVNCAPRWRTLRPARWPHVAVMTPATAAVALAPKLDLCALVKEVKLTVSEPRRAELVEALCKEDVQQWLHFDRLALLRHLKEDLGVSILSDRQSIVNGFGRLRRGQGLTPPPLPPRKPLTDLQPSMQERREPRWQSPAAPVWTSSPNVLTPAGGESTRSEVRHWLLTGAAGYEFRDGYVRVSCSKAPPSIRQWAADFGECSDSRCGCYRLAIGPAGNARAFFRNAVVWQTVEQMKAASADHSRSGSGVRYVSVGCGQLLTDFEVLCGLQEMGLAIESIIFVDRIYASSWRTHKEAFKLVAGFFAYARVYAFGSSDELVLALEASPEVYGKATTYVHCDAEDFATHKSKALAGRLLVPGGHSFQLHNNGSASNSREAWRRRDWPKENRSWGRGDERGDDHFASLLEQIHLGQNHPLVTPRAVARSLPGTRVYRVVHTSAVVLRSAPSMEAKILGVRKPETEVVVESHSNATDERGRTWVKLCQQVLVAAI